MQLRETANIKLMAFVMEKILLVHITTHVTQVACLDSIF